MSPATATAWELVGRALRAGEYDDARRRLREIASSSGAQRTRARTFAARWPRPCAVCGSTIDVGARAVWRPFRGVVHEGCARAPRRDQ